MTETKGGKKFDTGKPDLSLIPLPALVEEAKGFMLGESKYGRYNYTGGMEASRLVAAALRHITTWMEGEDNDPESGASHLGHARCCLAMILHTQQLGTLKDNRRVQLGESNAKAIFKVDYEPIFGSNFLDHIK